MNKLLEKIKAASTIKEIDTLADSKLFSDQDMIQVPVPALNVAFSGSFDGGFVPGISMFAAPSKHFKTGFLLLCMKTYLDQYPESIAILYINEFGSPKSYFDAFDIDPERVLLCPIVDIEQLREDLTNQLHNFSRGDKVFIAIDSIGNLASRKEVKDALDGSDKADMTRAKILKSTFRIATPHLMLKNIPLFVVNHTYKEMALFPKDIVSGGTGSYYSSDTIFTIGRQQDAEKVSGKKVLNGYTFVVKIEKSRYVREGSKFNIDISFDEGIYKYSNIEEWALELGLIEKINGGFTYKDEKFKTDADKDKVLEEILKMPEFREFVSEKYKMGESDLVVKDESNE